MTHPASGADYPLVTCWACRTTRASNTSHLLLDDDVLLAFWFLLLSDRNRVSHHHLVYGGGLDLQAGAIVQGIKVHSTSAFPSRSGMAFSPLPTTRS